jgi:hypothetical protein
MSEALYKVALTLAILSIPGCMITGFKFETMGVMLMAAVFVACIGGAVAIWEHRDKL